MNSMEECETSFVEIFGTSPLIRVLDFLLTYREFDYSLTDISRESKVGWHTLHLFFFRLVEKGIVKKTRQVGRSKLYKLNIENPIVEKLIEVDNAITSRAIDEGIKNQQLVYSA